MKKILFMVTSMNIGGVEKSLLSLLNTIPKDKYDITLMLLEEKGGYLEYVPQNIKIIEATWFKDIKPIIMESPYKIVKKFIKEKKFIKCIRFIYCYFVDKYLDNRFLFYKNVMREIPMNKEKYDVAIAYQGPTDIIDYYIAYKVKADKKISWLHFDVSKHAFNNKLYTKLYKKYNKIFVVSNEAKNVLVSQINNITDNTEVFFNIVCKDTILKMAKEKVDFDDSYKGIKIVTVGRLSKEKGQDMAIEALYQLRKSGYDVKWYCVGDGNDREYYEEMIKEYNLQEYFILLGAKTNPYYYMKEADIYVQTSRHEGYCLTLAEAKCLEKVIITTNFITASNQIIDGENGFICEMNSDSIYRKIEFIINNDIQMKYIKNNLESEKFNVEKNINKLMEFID